MGTSPVFTGVSTYASDLQQVITRAVSIASMPLQQMSNRLQDMSSESSSLKGLDSQFTALQTAIQNLDTALGPTSYSATSSDPTSVRASVTAGALEGSYTVTVNSLGSPAAAVSSASLPAVTDPYSSSLSSATAFTLTVGSQSFSIQPADTSLMGLATAINGASTGVQASIVNAGGPDSPNYRLVLRATGLGPNSIALREGAPDQTPPGADLLDATPLSPGSDASYTIGGLNQTIQSSSSSVTLAPGLTIDLLKQTTSPVTVTVARGVDSISNAMSAFVDAYNATVDQLNQQVGPNSGALAGQFIVQSLFGTLRQITQYSASSGGVSSLAQLGVNLDKTGKLSLDTTKLYSLNVEAIQGFLGSASAGGFLKTANDALNNVEDATSGWLKTAISSKATEISHENDLMTAEQQRLADLQDNLTKRMAAADTLLASLESKKSYMTDLFTSMMNQYVSNNSKSG
jgi:flagellar hook-associated protein 2